MIFKLMAKHRFFCPFGHEEREVMLCDPDELQHLSKVLRLKVGDQVELINGCGGMASGCLKDIARSAACIIINEASFTSKSDPLKVTLACAIPKKAKFETIIEKCTELGVDRIIPLITERTEVDLTHDRIGKKSERYERVALNAAKQSRRLWFPQIDAPMDFNEAIKTLSSTRAKLLIPWLEGKRLPLMEAMADSPDGEVVFLIGPEGDFTKAEVDMAIDLGAIPVTLGINVLKVDTAAIAVAAVKIWRYKK